MKLPDSNAHAATEIKHALAGAKTRAGERTLRQLVAARTQRLAAVVTAALVRVFERAGLHHLSSNACSTCSILPSASASGT
jgi:hypothetical protein